MADTPRKRGKHHLRQEPPPVNPARSARRAAGEQQFRDPVVHDGDVIRYDATRGRMLIGGKPPKEKR